MNLHVHTAPIVGEAFCLSIGHRHAWEALEGLGEGLRGVCDWYSQPSFHLSHCLIVPDQSSVRRARVSFERGVFLLQRSLGTP